MRKISKNRGITLTELMVAAVILGTLSLVAITSYDGFVGQARSAQVKTDLGGLQKKWIGWTAGSESYCKNINGECASLYNVGAGDLLLSLRYNIDKKYEENSVSDEPYPQGHEFEALCKNQKEVKNPFQPAFIGFTWSDCGECDAKMIPDVFGVCRKKTDPPKIKEWASIGGPWGDRENSKCTLEPHKFTMGAVTRTRDSGDKIILAHYTLTTSRDMKEDLKYAGILYKTTEVKYTDEGDLDDSSKNDDSDAKDDPSVRRTCVN